MSEFEEAVVAAAVRAGLPADAARRAVGVPKERDRADLALPCFPFSKELKKAPAEIAKAVAAAFEPGDLLTSAEAVGPVRELLRATRHVHDARARRRAATTTANHTPATARRSSSSTARRTSPSRWLFHHLRSAAIGQALSNICRWRGYDVVSMTFLGDTGTAFGRLLVGVEEFGGRADRTWRASAVTYVEASKRAKSEPAFAAKAREWAKRLEDDDAEAVRQWEVWRKSSLEGFRRAYDWLGVHHDVIDGERMYVARAQELVEEALENGKAEESDGAVVIPTGLKTPFLVRKRDGATLYGTRDIAAAQDRWQRYHFDRMLYVVDIAQEVHFKQLFAALSHLGCDWADRCAHVSFGQVLVGGSRAKTREGESIRLDDVLAESQRRALEIIEEKNADLHDKEAVAKAVGTAAVLFTDVGFPIRKNINFEWDEILSFDGRTGPYLQYVHASAASILRKGEGAGEGDPALLTDDHEWDLVRRIAEFPRAVERACDENEPSLVSNYLYDLAREFRGYHTAGGRDAALRVLTENDELKAARLGLVRAVQRTLATGLRLLGIEPVERM